MGIGFCLQARAERVRLMRNERIRNSARHAGPLISLLSAIAIAAMGCSDAYAASLVLVAADSAPTAYMEDGKPDGIIVDVVTEAFRRTGHPLEIELMPWARCMAEIRSGRVDGIISVFRLPERDEFL